MHFNNMRKFNFLSNSVVPLLVINFIECYTYLVLKLNSCNFMCNFLEQQFQPRLNESLNQTSCTSIFEFRSKSVSGLQKISIGK